MKKFTLIVLLSTFCFAQNANRKYKSHKLTNGTLEVKTSDGVYLIKPYSDKIVETSFVPKGETFKPESHAVVLTPKAKDSKVKDTKDFLIFTTKGITVSIEKSPFKISYSYKNKELFSEKNGYTKADNMETLDFNINDSEALYGGGSRVLGMNRRGNRLQLYNRAQYGYSNRAELLNFCIPMVMSSKIYAIHFDNPAIGYLDLDSKKNNTITYETISGRKTYQVIAGDSWTDIIANYTDLTGKQPLPARWTFGNFSSKFGYHNQAEVGKTIQKFQNDSIPVDAIIIDLYWFGKTIQGTLGNLDWDKDNFPDPTKMIADLNAKNIKTVLITEPFVLTTSSKWKEAVDKKVLAVNKDGAPFIYDFYFGNTGIIDVFKPEGKQWFWNIYKNLINQGVGGLWGDLGEPEAFPSEAITAKGKADEVHNIYGHNWAKLVANGYQKDFPNQRPFILMRSGYSGSQQYGIIPWSGDISRSWEGLQSQTEIALQMGMQGIGYMHSDLGGFAGDYFDNELYIRWLQYGVFQPVFRPHADESVASEPVYKDIETKAKAKKQIELRYQMLPYNYTLAFENNQKGTPLMRPLLFEEPTNQALQTVCETYLWGNDFLITPITKPGLKEIPVYFPKNNNWFDFYTDQKQEAGTTSNIAIVEDHIPVFVRGGAFIPMIKTIQNTSKYSLDNFDLHFYNDEKTAKSEGKLYNDNGTIPNAFEKGESELLKFSSNSNEKTLTLTIQTVTGKSFLSTDKKINFIVHNLNKKIKNISSNGQNIAYTITDKTIAFPVLSKKGQTNTILINYN
ncbi:TIM-barrel domain-containing protein [Flavobacterium sp. 123]|uniref:glycoside hydrolase family 31 protein n=1 Tax=Flavobacterium sp. 123 TaxID=2135627 RepID=UPI000EAC80A4|nr:TIM-barrel domain-containing protein [Flavobacterium sp. 123]RKS99745.1 oligosaccharide 4-alpha-D-glucosyltransferase [Flavobacterium sp. 123]